MGSLRDGELATFFVRLRDYDGAEQTRVAIELVLHTMVRTEDLRGATWSEVGRDQWRIPAERMKMSLEHIVPITPTLGRLLQRLRELSGGSRLIVPGEKPGKSISQNTMIYALYRMGYHGRLTIHGFRRTASTILNESGLWEPDWIERQLAHVEVNKVRRALNAAQYPRAPHPHDAVVVGLPECAEGHQRVAGIMMRRCRVGLIGFSGGMPRTGRRATSARVSIELHGSTNGRQPILHGG